MSKAKHALITSAKPTPTRHNAPSTGRPASVPSVSQIYAPPALSAGGIPPSRDCLELQLVASLLYEVVSVRARLKDRTPECVAAEVRVDDGYKRLSKVCNRIRQKPVRSWSDLRDLAEVAYYWADKEGSGEPTTARTPMRYLTSEHASQFDIASAHLVQAVLKIGGANA
jgi:hypothetical protein